MIKANSPKVGDAKPTDLKLRSNGGWVAGVNIFKVTNI